MNPLNAKGELLQYPGAHPSVLATNDILRHGVQGITAQFREDAAVYDERYLNVEAKRHTIERALNSVNRWPREDAAILDIGAGSGNATFALLQLFPGSTIACTDLSPELLSILAVRAERMDRLKQLVPFVADASLLSVDESCLDLVVGSSMVHHLLDPHKFMESIVGSLRPGGVAIFLEPFQAGHLVVRMLLSSLLQLSVHKRGLTEERAEFFRRYIITIDTMFREDRDDEIFNRLDDKWMFTRETFQSVARRTGAGITIFSTNTTDHPFRQKITDLLLHGLGDSGALPDWALEMIGAVDAHVSASLREELLTEGCIVFSKGI